MRPLVDCFFALAGVLFFGVAACAAESQSDLRARVDEARSRTHNAPHTVTCLGGVLNEDPAVNYLTLGDYPAQPAPPSGRRRIVICGDRIPPFIPWLSYGSSAGSHGH
jgi:hypothetical protein